MLQSCLVFLSLRVKQLESGSFLISLEGPLGVETEDRGHCQITVDVVGMNRESRS